MPEALKERSQIEEKYKWDLTRMFADDATDGRLSCVGGTYGLQI